MQYHITIVGAGCSGLFLAARLSEILPKGFDILLIEKTNDLGNKLLLSGNGQCNFTNINSKSIPFFKTMSYKTLIDYFENKGIKTMIREDGKVFPKSMQASEIRNMLVNIANKYPIKILTNTTLTDFIYESEYISLVFNPFSSIVKTKYLVLCTGGASFPETGSTGDSIKLLEKHGIKMKQFKPALSVPEVVFCRELPPAPLKEGGEVVAIKEGVGFDFKNFAGLVINNATCKIESNLSSVNRTISGTLLFTHIGLSGPLILDNSKYFNKGDILRLYLTNYTELHNLDEQILSLITKYPKKTLKNILCKLPIARRLLSFIFSNINTNLLSKKASEISKIERKSILHMIFSIEFKIQKLGDLSKAMCSSGGVDLSEINKKNMSLKKLPNVFVAGECIDVDAPTGGYNIHIAFATSSIIAKNWS